MADRHLYGLVVLIQRRGPHRDDSLIGTRLRGSDLEHLTFDGSPLLAPESRVPLYMMHVIIAGLYDEHHVYCQG